MRCSRQALRTRPLGVAAGLVLGALLCPARLVAHTLTAPSSVRAFRHGSFTYTAIFVADAPVDVAGAGFNALLNVDPPQSHGDGFCIPHVDPGERSQVNVAGTLLDITQGGLVEVWFAPCGGPTLFARTEILAPGGPRRFVITGHPPLSEIRVGPLVAKRKTFEGSAVLALNGGAETVEVMLHARLRLSAHGLVYRMRSRKGEPARVKATIVTGGDPETVQNTEITVKPKEGQKVKVRGPADVRLTTAARR